MAKAERLQRARALAVDVGLPAEILGGYPIQMSGGQRQRVNIARALCAKPRRYWKDTERPRAKRQVNYYLKCLRALFAIAEAVRDPVTRLPIVDQGPEVRLYKMPKRLPRPMGDEELHARMESAPPWTRDAAELARLFGLRLGRLQPLNPLGHHHSALASQER